MLKKYASLCARFVLAAAILLVGGTLLLLGGDVVIEYVQSVEFTDTVKNLIEAAS